MRRKIPSTAALCAFDAAAKYKSFTKAAEDLFCTQGAVCRQIASLEAFLGVKLFRRDGRGVTLTEAGLAYSRKVASMLDELERDTLDVITSGGTGGTLELAVVPTFATKWLLPRMPDFMASHPDIMVNLSTRTRPFLFDGTEFDAAIHASATRWPGAKSHFLMNESLIAVCSPTLLPSSHRMKKADWNSCTLLQQSTRPYAWRDWFAAMHIEVDADTSGPRFELYSMQTEAAINGLGLALIPRLLIEDELTRGTLVEIDSRELLSDRCYYLTYPEAKADSQALTAFLGWIEEQAQKYRAE